MNRRKTLVALALAAAGLGFGATHAQTRWDMPTPYVDGEFHTVNNRAFADDLRKASNGQLDIAIHSGQSLIKHPDILRAVSTGQVNIGEVLLGQFGNEDPMFEVDNLPLLATGFDASWRLYQAHRPHLERALQKRGLRLLYSVAWPGQGIFTKTELKSLDDLKGTKFRTYSALTARFAELLGASPTVVQATEIPQAFATNTVQAMITSAATGVSFKAWEYTRFYYNTAAFHPRNMVIVNARAYERLSEPLRKAIAEAAAAAEKRGWESARRIEAERNRTLADNGMRIVEPDAAMRAQLARIGDTMLAEWLKKAGADGEALVKTYRGR